MRTLLRVRRSRRGPLLLPSAEFLLLVTLLLPVSWLHRSHRLGERMRPLLRRTPVRRLSLGAFLRLRSSLRFPHPRLRLRQAVPTAGRAEGTEVIFTLRLRLPSNKSGLHWPTRRFLPHQR
jgi:hypothetical protein